MDANLFMIRYVKTSVSRLFLYVSAYLQRVSFLKSKIWSYSKTKIFFKPLATNDIYIRRTEQLTSRRCILNIYATNILTEYFKHAAHSPFLSLQDAVYFIMLSFLVPVIFTF